MAILGDLHDSLGVERIQSIQDLFGWQDPTI